MDLPAVRKPGAQPHKPQSKISKDNPAKIAADWRTGDYTMEQLVAKYKISVGSAAKYITFAGEDFAPVMNSTIQYYRGLAGLNEQTIQVIEDLARNKSMKLQLISDGSLFYISGSLFFQHSNEIMQFNST